uniref:Sulfatase domain-containing protein n=1 Tax=Panagrellus redivivus TaxID=6233 RepID=A0A7E4VDV6_PANRE
METECREEVLKDETQPIDSEVKEKTYYEFLHAQIYRNTTSELVEEPKELEKPDVHLIIFDAVSESQFIRSMPKTRHYLREYYEAVSFRHLNKVGDNSRPNGFALLLGKAVDPIKKSPMSVGYKSDFVDTGCDTPLDHDQFVGFQFQEAGYKTLMSEDWALGVFNWPYCIGFQEKPPVDHYMRPFQLRVEGKYRTKFLQNNTYQGVCRPPFTPQMEYLQDFLDKYPDKPKFTLTWMTYATHDSVNGLFPADDYFYDFFKKNNAKLNNSYVFVMADHGFRYYPEANTTLGKKEDRNPLLFMSLPASLRRDKDLMATVRNNAHQLISHYDLYATLADIVAPHRPQNSSKILLHGSSVLKPLPQPRTCDRLRIPFEYCLCENENVELPDDAAPSREAAALMVQKMNSVIKKDKHLKGRCATLTLSHAPVALKQFEFGGNFTIYQVTFQVLPGNGEFSGYIEQNANSTDWKLFNDHLSRLDIYGETARCAKKSTFAPYCYCKSLFKKNQ